MTLNDGSNRADGDGVTILSQKPDFDFELVVKEPTYMKHDLSTDEEDEGDQEDNPVNNEHAKDQAPKEAVPEKVPDGGYGWFIVLGCFLSHVIIGGFERGDGVFYLQFLERYGYSAQLTAWPGALVSACRLGLGPLASAVVNRYSVRSSCIVGALLMAGGLALTAFAPNFYFLFFSFVLVHGLGRTLCYAPSLIIVGMYFNKKRGVATGIGCSGVGVGTLVITQLSQFLFDFYGFTGAFLVLSGITLNLLFIAMLYRPLSMHRQIMRADRLKNVIAENGDISNEEYKQLQLKEAKDVKGEEVGSTKPPENCLKSVFKTIFPIEHKGEHKLSNKKLFQFSLLKNIPFLFYCLSICLFTLAFKSAFTFLPALVKSRGMSSTEAASVLSITGIVDTAGRILAGLCLDLRLVRPYRTLLYNSFMFFIAAIAFLMPAMQTYWQFVMIACAYAMLTGGYISQKSVIIVDLLGAEHMANSFGLLICFQGIGTLIGPPLSGAFKDHFGNYDEAFYLGGGCMVVAACLMVLSNIFLRIQRKKASEK